MIFPFDGSGTLLRADRGLRSVEWGKRVLRRDLGLLHIEIVGWIFDVSIRHIAYLSLNLSCSSSCMHFSSLCSATRPLFVIEIMTGVKEI